MRSVAQIFTNLLPTDLHNLLPSHTEILAVQMTNQNLFSTLG